jgi:hypothetical protein
MKKITRKTKKHGRIGGAAPPIADQDPDVERGLKAWQRLMEAGRTSWADWKLIGTALMAGRRHAMEKASTNRPAGKRYNEAFHYWLETRGFLEIDKADRGKLLSIMEDLDRIEKWREGLTEAQRAAWNSPSTVWRVSRCKDRGINAVNKKAEVPMPDPKDLPPSAEFEEEDKEVSWQRGLLGRVRKAIGDIKILDWRLPEPPDRGLITVVNELVEEATELRDYLQRVHEESTEVGEETGDESQSHQPEPVGAD